jgi:hypothetical protein
LASWLKIGCLHGSLFFFLYTSNGSFINEHNNCPPNLPACPLMGKSDYRPENPVKHIDSERTVKSVARNRAGNNLNPHNINHRFSLYISYL